MSFVRLGQDGSQVYIYDDVRGYKICCFCPSAKVTHDADGPHWQDFTTNDLDKMLEHIAEHRKVGHHVPEWVDQVLRDEWEVDA